MPAFMPCPFMFIPAFIPYPLIPAFIPCPVIPAFILCPVIPAFIPCPVIPYPFIPAFPAFIPCPFIPAFPAFIPAPEPKLLAPAFDPYPLILLFITCPFKASLFPVRIYLPTVFPVKHLVN